MTALSLATVRQVPPGTRGPGWRALAIDLPMTASHTPVLLDQVLDALAVRPGGIYVDATFGRGGHSAAMVDRLGGDGRLIALDRDPEACAEARRRFGDDGRVSVHHANFADLGEVLEKAGARGRVDGLLMDLGVSSPQLDQAARGFSFRHGGPLDMRMDPGTGVSAAAWLARVDEDELARVLRDYGEERLHRRIARAIVRARSEVAIATTSQLAEIVSAAVPRRPGPPPRIHPATRTFMALRIFVNAELDALRAALPQAIDALAPGGRLAVIAFHSLEDRIVKRELRAAARPSPPDPLRLLPPPAARLRLLGRARRPDASEAERNPRARSAVLRVAEKLEPAGA